jgi:hypothetical protein
LLGIGVPVDGDLRAGILHCNLSPAARGRVESVPSPL